MTDFLGESSQPDAAGMAEQSDARKSPIGREFESFFWRRLRDRQRYAHKQF